MADYRDDSFQPLAGFVGRIAAQGFSPGDASMMANAAVTGDCARLKSKSTGEVWLWSQRRSVAGSGVLNTDFDLFSPGFGTVQASPGRSGAGSWAETVENPDILIESGPASAYVEREFGVSRPQSQIAGEVATAAFDPASEESMLRKRGPKPRYEWGVFHDALMERIFDNDGLFELQADDERWAAGWFESRYGKSPGESELRKHVRETRDRFLELRRSKKQGK